MMNIFEISNNKEDLDRVSQGENPGLASVANGRGGNMTPQKKRTRDFGHKGAVTPANPIGGEVKPCEN